MNTLESVKPANMRISAFLDSARQRPLQPAPHVMRVAYDPQSLSIKQDNTFETKQGPSTGGSSARFYASGSRQLTVTLLLVGVDFGSYGLNVAPSQPTDVSGQLDLFQRLCQWINGESHEPAYLQLNWDKGGLRSTFEARLKTYDIRYSLFDRGGKPLLADLDATFVEAVHPVKQQARQRLSSPDLSHRHLVLAGETLPMLCLRYYGRTDPLLQVAAFNGLDNLRVLTPGQHLLFPPL
ncbi:MAG: hypothetical protein ACK5XN_24480, partial [Bacteroidota bacterium]